MEIIKDWAVEVVVGILVLFLGTAAVSPKENVCKERIYGTNEVTQKAASR